MKCSRFVIPFLAVALAFGASACKPKAVEQTTITVWDYYGKEVSPIAPIIEAFRKENPGIVVNREDLDWDTMHTKLNVVLSGGEVPDVVTADMTWLPMYASLGALADIGALSGGKLNGQSFDQAWAPFSLKAMSHEGKYVAALYDFDAYALYYRSDLFDALGLQAPKNWDELVKVGKALAKGDMNLMCFQPDFFHVAQFIYENGGSILTPDNKKAAFNDKAGMEAFRYCTDLVFKHRMAMNWIADSGDVLQGTLDGRLAMWTDGPYRMAQLKEAAPDMAGKWRIAPHPGNKQAGSYLGGTGLVIPEKSAHKEAAWKFIEFMLRPENAKLVYTKAGAAPALLSALADPEVNAPDPYFGGQKPMEVYKQALESAVSFPKIRQWEEIDVVLNEMIAAVMNKSKTLDDAVKEAAEKVDGLLAE